MKKLIIKAFAPSVLAALSVASASNAQSQGVQQSKTSELAAIAEQVHDSDALRYGCGTAGALVVFAVGSAMAKRAKGVAP